MALLGDRPLDRDVAELRPTERSRGAEHPRRPSLGDEICYDHSVPYYLLRWGGRSLVLQSIGAAGAASLAETLTIMVPTAADNAGNAGKSSTVLAVPL